MRAGMMLWVLGACVQTQKRLCTFPPLEALLLSLLTSCKMVRLLGNVVAARGGSPVRMVHMIERRTCSIRGPAASPLIGMTDLWDRIFTQKSDQEGLRSLGTVLLEEKTERQTVPVRSPAARTPCSIGCGRRSLKSCNLYPWQP